MGGVDMQDELIQTAYEDMDALYNFYVQPSISKMATDLEIDVDTFIQVFARKVSMSEDLARKLRYLRAIKLGTAYSPCPKSKLDTYNDIIEFGTVYVPSPKPLIDKFKDIIEFGTAYVKGPRSRLDIYNDIIESGTCYYPAPKPELEPVDSSLIDEAQSRLLDLLKNIPIQELAIKLKIAPMQIQNFLENRESISPNIANKLRFIWQIVYGTCYFPGHKSSIDELLECSIFVDVYRFVGKNNKSYKSSNIKDVLPEKIEDVQYDDALKRVMPKINEIIYIFFKKNLKIEQIKEIIPGITPVCPKYRKFELEIINEDNVVDYFLIYSRGVLIDCTEGFPFEKIVAVLKNEQSWEK